MPFSIRIARVPSSLPETPDLFFEGAIEIGDFRERFWASAGTWIHEQYVDQWRVGLRRLCDEGLSSALITSLTGEGEEELATWWPMIPEGDSAVIWQEHRHPLLSPRAKFRADSWLSGLPVSRPIGTDGHDVSEWTVPIAELRSVLSKEDFYLDLPR